MAARGTEAAEFQKILDPPGIVFANPDILVLSCKPRRNTPIYNRLARGEVGITGIWRSKDLR
jgi:hypothetical protein